jgi:hypothetical protein
MWQNAASPPKQFGRRGLTPANNKPLAPPLSPAPVAEQPAVEEPAQPTTDLTPLPDHKWEELKATQSQRPASYKAPWRTFFIMASVGYGFTSWLLPGEVAQVTEIAFGIMGAASLYAGYRQRLQARL